MIIGICLRNFKVYRNINYIPLSDGSNFSAIIGLNGVGKSTILEALDCFFNQKLWIHHIDNSAIDDSWVMPVFALQKSDKELEDYPLIKKISNYVIRGDLGADAISANYRPYVELLRNNLPKNIGDCYILPICIQCNYRTTLGLFNTVQFKQAIFTSDLEEREYEAKLQELYDLIRTKLSYVYVPKDIEADKLANFENQEIQRLIGKDLEDIIKTSLPKEKISSISQNLKNFVGEVSDSLDGYVFRTSSYYQPNLKPYKIYSLIIEEFFALRKLYKTVNDGKDIPLSQLSSGEKQQAIISLVTKIISNYRESGNRLIVAMDEPESSLHISLCYSQFERLYDISNICCQVLLTSHWYGFIPTLTGGNIVNISLNEKHEVNIFDVFRYKEQLRIADGESKGQLPVDITLKSNNDLIQSILSSIIRNEGYNWLICEGSSDKIYLNEYLKEEIEYKHLRIIPVCKAKEVKKMYDQLSLAAEDMKKDIKGKVFLLVDTDANFYNIPTHNVVDELIRCRRIVNDKENTLLVKCEANPQSPKTDIEDALNGKLFHKTLLTFKDANPELAIIDDSPKDECCSGYAMNLGQQDYEKLDTFFNKNKGQNKVQFALAYIKIMNSGQYIVPHWIQEIKNFFKNTNNT